MYFTAHQIASSTRTRPMQELVYMMSSRCRAATKAWTETKKMSDEERNVWLTLFRGEIEFIRNALGSHALEEFTYDVPIFLQSSFKANGPPDIPWNVDSTSPDCLVAIYVDAWWEDKDILCRSGKERNWEELEMFGLYFHSDMLSKNYDTGTDPQVSSATVELDRMKQLRESIARGGKILEVELERLTEKLIGLEERLQESTMAIQVMAHKYRDVWADAYATRLTKQLDPDIAEDGDECETDAGSDSVQPPTTSASDFQISPLSSSSGKAGPDLPIINTITTPSVPPSSLSRHSAGVPIARPVKSLPRRAATTELQPIPYIRFTTASMEGCSPSSLKLRSPKVASSEVPAEFQEMLDF